METIYWSNVKLFWERSFLSSEDTTFTALKCLLEFIFFMPNFIIFPLAWTLFDTFKTHTSPNTSPSPEENDVPVEHLIEVGQAHVGSDDESSEDSFSSQLSPNDSYNQLPSYEVSYDAHALEHGRNLFETLHTINSDGYQGGYIDFNLAVRDISENSADLIQAFSPLF